MTGSNRQASPIKAAQRLAYFHGDVVGLHTGLPNRREDNMRVAGCHPRLKLHHTSTSVHHLDGQEADYQRLQYIFMWQKMELRESSRQSDLLRTTTEYGYMCILRTSWVLPFIPQCLAWDQSQLTKASARARPGLSSLTGMRFI